MKKSKESRAFNRALRISGIIPIIVGLLFIAVAGFLYFNSTKTVKTKTPVEAVITRIVYDYDGDIEKVLVTYTVDGVEYKDIPLNSYDSSMHTNKTITVYYDAGNPDSVSYANTPVFVYLIIVAFGLLSLGVGLFGLLSGKLGNKKLKELKASGSRREVTVYRADIRWNTTINGRHPALITFIDTATGTQYQQKTYVWSGQEFLVGDKYDLYIDPHDPSKYAVDYETLVRPVPESPVGYGQFDPNGLYNSGSTTDNGSDGTTV